MKRVWKFSLGLSLGLFVTRASGEEVQWRPAAPRAALPAQSTENLSLVQPPAPSIPSAPAPTTSLPVPAVPVVSTTESAPLKTAVFLERPVPVRPLAVAEPPVCPVACATQPDGPRLVTRGQSADAPRPMPMGPPPKEEPKDPKDVKPDSSLKMPTPVPGGTNPTPLPDGVIPAPSTIASGPITSSPIVSEGPVLGGDMVDGEMIDGDGCVEDDCCDDEDGTCFGHWPLFNHHGWGHAAKFDGWGKLGWFDKWGGGGDGNATGERFYLRGEYILWGISNSESPTLVTGSFSRARNAGALGAPGTVPVIGGEIDPGALSGGRFTGGWWFGPGKQVGLEGSAFFLGPESNRAAVGSFGNVGVFRPFFDAGRGETAARVAFPRDSIGVVAVDTSTHLWGSEANVLFNCYTGPAFRFVFLGGYRHVGVDESLVIGEHFQQLRGRRTATMRVDSFNTENRFHGGQVGGLADWRLGHFTIGLSGKLAMGSMAEAVNAAGLTMTTTGTRLRTVPVGLLVQPSNSGRFETSRFALIPELGVTVGYQITDCIRLYAGYNLMYLGNVVRPGNQIDRVINTTLTTRRPRGGVRPLIPLDDTDLVAHGLSAGLEFRY